jgi:cyclopropane-fatty-acyl-phospholipid synthase
MSGELEITDQTAFIYWACLNDDLLKNAFHGNIFGTLLHKLERLFQPNTVKGAKQNIMAHYDLGNDFYDKWLDPTMSYSSAIFEADYNPGIERTNENLTQAQFRKYDRIIDALEIKSGDSVLEIGCGWGGFFSRAVERTGCHITAVMNSPAQCSYNESLIHRKNLKQHVHLNLTDYRLIQGQFDKIVSIEMIEAVGEKYWSTYFNKLKQTLKPQGKALIQSITIREDRFQEYRSSTDFIKKYIFPGGMLLTNNNIAQQSKNVDLRSGQPFEFGLGYAETLRRWRIAFNQSLANGALKLADERFIKLWNFYFSYCEGAFLAGRINVAQFELEN